MYASRDRAAIERAYFDILAQLAMGPKSRDELEEGCRGSFDGLVDDCLRRLEHEYRIAKEGNSYRLLDEEERKEAVSEPQADPIKTIYEKGTVPGAHDNGVFAMIAFYEMVGLSWEETKENVVEWIQETGAWERGGFAEKTPEELVEKKRHVYDEGYGWMDKAEAAKRVIDQEIA